MANMEPHDNSCDAWLDKALHQYGETEPRPGLEARIFANLAANSRTETPFWKWGWIAAFATFLILGLSVWLNHHDHLLHTTPIAESSRPETMHIGPVQRSAETAQPPKSKEVIAKAHAAKTEASAFKRLARDPRLPQFPAQRPLSKQEQLLKQYVEQFPAEAMVVARVQTETQKELEKLVRDESSNTEPDQEER
jgi:hypothetical protein